MTPAEARAVIQAMRRKGAITSLPTIDGNMVELVLRHPTEDETVTIKMALDKEDSTPEHLRELIEWQMAEWR